LNGKIAKREQDFLEICLDPDSFFSSTDRIQDLDPHKHEMDSLNCQQKLYRNFSFAKCNYHTSKKCP